MFGVVGTSFNCNIAYKKKTVDLSLLILEYTVSPSRNGDDMELRGHMKLYLPDGYWPFSRLKIQRFADLGRHNVVPVWQLLMRHNLELGTLVDCMAEHPGVRFADCTPQELIAVTARYGKWGMEREIGNLLYHTVYSMVVLDKVEQAGLIRTIHGVGPARLPKVLAALQTYRSQSK